MYRLGPRAQRVLTGLRARIDSGELATGTKLPAHTELARVYGVAPLTVRQVLAQLESEGIVSREHGRGTFVRSPTLPAVLIVDDEAGYRAILQGHVAAAGHRALTASGPAEAMAALESDAGVRLVMSDIRMPTSAEGIAFIRSVRRRWSTLPLAAVTAYPDDLSGLFGTPECPVMVLAKPFRPAQVEEVLRLAVGTSSGAAAQFGQTAALAGV